MDREIVIVGAGPVGLTAALAVRATGRHATIVEAGASDRVRPGSRAIFIHNASLRLLERVRPGLGHTLNARGLTWLARQTYYRGSLVYRRTYAPLPAGALPPATSLPQVTTEQVLYAACLDAGVEFVWNSAVNVVTASARGVQLGTETGGALTARYVIAADGARSAVRESCDIHLEGPRTSNAFVIVDASEDERDPMPLERTFHYEHPAVGGRNVLFVPFAGHWRVDLQCLTAEDPGEFSGVDGVRTWLPKVMPRKYAERVTWVSTYIFRQAVASRFVDASRRVLLAGEAAHIFAPFGARGLNSGMADALVAADAIHRALRAATPAEADRAISRFARSRRDAAVRNRAASSQALRHMAARSPATRAVRGLAARLAPSFPAVGRWMDKAPFGPPLGPPDADGMQY
jgi:3-(3-hydroxy-phenyl)propionate hydroxylase